MKIIKILPGLVLLHILIVMGYHQLSAANRQYETIVISGEQFDSFFGSAIENLYMMSYHDSSSSWIFIPFQIDERQQLINGSNINYSYFAADDGIFDEFDQLLFMAYDVGDRVDNTNWPNFADSENPIKRYEITVIDTVDTIPVNTGFVYFYWSPAPITAFENYIDADRDNDIILSKNYEMSFIPTSGLPQDLKIKAENGGDNQNFLDRLKMKLKLTLPLFGQVLITEDAISKIGTTRFVTGPVRIIRDIPFILKISLGNVGQITLPDTFNVNLQFFPYSMKISIPNLDLSVVNDIGSLDWIRFTFDYNSFADGMTFLNPNNEFIIDGLMSQDEINANKELIVPGVNWILASGNHGSMMTITNVPDIGDNTGLYYYDNKFTPDLNDTGDHVSYGDSGFFIEGNITNALFNFLSTVYFLPPNLAKNDAEQLFIEQNNPLDFQIVYQEDFTDVSDNYSEIPKSFSFMQIYPNPYYYLNNQTLNIKFYLTDKKSVNFTLYNLLGQKIAQIPEANYSKGEKIISWKIANEALQSGLYWLIAKGKSTLLKQKLLILK